MRRAPWPGEGSGMRVDVARELHHISQDPRFIPNPSGGPMRSSVLALLTTIAFSAPVASHAAPVYQFDKTHTNITWSANHFGFSNPSGKWMDVDGSLELDEQTPANSKVDATITIGSLITGYDKFDAHLKSADFFDAEKFPTARFVSTKVTPTGANTANVDGNLTLHGVTKPVTLMVTLNKIGENPINKKKTAGFSATTTLKRSDFGINYAIPGVSDEVKIAIETELNLNMPK